MDATGQTTDLEVDPERVAAWRAEDPELLLVDVREPYEYDAGHIEGSTHIQLTDLPAAADSFSEQRPVVFYCRVGPRAEMAAQALRASGFEAYWMRGGLLRWAAEERPLQPDDGSVADH